MPENCPICSAPGSQLCSACMKVSYCSSKHQKQDWKSHEQSCCPFKVKNDPEQGECWVASRNLKAGIILWEEVSAFSSSVILTPCFKDVDLDAKDNDNDKPDKATCITCGLHIDAMKTFRCSTCNWPVCGVDCEHNGIHASNECKAFTAGGVQFPPPNISQLEITYCILLIRASGFRKFRSKKYQEMLDIADTIPELDDIDALAEHGEQLQRLQTIVPSLRSESLEDQFKLLRFFKVKGIMTQIYGEFLTPPPVNSVMCLFPQASHMAHSCAPNCTWAITSFPECKIRIKTAVPVKAGEPLTMTYFIKEHSYGTYFRQKNMLDRTGKVCRCRRCLDPTELGTYMSAMTCRICWDTDLARGDENETNLGYLLPIDPLDTGEYAMWQCNQCELNILAPKLTQQVEAIHKRMKAEEKMLVDVGQYLTHKVERLYTCVIQHYQRFCLHPNHWILQEAAKGILKFHAKLFASKPSNLDMNQLDQCVCYCEYLLAIENEISPGLSLNRASIQRRHSQAILLKYINLKEPTDMDKELEQCRQFQSEAYRYYETRLPSTSVTDPLLVQDLIMEMHAAGCTDLEIHERSLKLRLQKATCIRYLNNHSVSVILKGLLNFS